MNADYRRPQPRSFVFVLSHDLAAKPRLLGEMPDSFRDGSF